MDDNMNFTPNLDPDLDHDHDGNMDWNTNSLHTMGVPPPAGKRISRVPLLSAARKEERAPSRGAGGTSPTDDDESSSLSFPCSLSHPRPLFFDTITRDFAYDPSHYLHHGPSDDDDDGGSGHMPALEPHRSHSQARRSSDCGESSTVNTGINSGAHWTPGIWGGDGAIYEDMSPLPSTSFRTPSEERSSWNRQQNQQHRKSRSYADVYSYERGRRRENSASKRGSFHGGGNDGAGYSDPAGREALRASRGMEPTGEDLLDDMYALSMRPRRDSHVAQQTLPSRSYHEDHRVATADMDSDLPLDHEDTQEDHSPQRESLGPEDEELFAGPSLALYDFEPENDNELRIREKEIIMVSYRHGQGWLVAQNAAGDAGLVPEAYVRLLSEMEDWEEVVEDHEEDDTQEDVDEEHPSTELNTDDGKTSSFVRSNPIEGIIHKERDRVERTAHHHPGLS